MIELSGNKPDTWFAFLWARESCLVFFWWHRCGLKQQHAVGTIAAVDRCVDKLAVLTRYEYSGQRKVQGALRNAPIVQYFRWQHFHLSPSERIIFSEFSSREGCQFLHLFLYYHIKYMKFVGMKSIVKKVKNLRDVPLIEQCISCFLRAFVPC